MDPRTRCSWMWIGCVALAALLLTSCAESPPEQETSGTGGIAARVEWPAGASAAFALRAALSPLTAPAGVVTMRATVTGPGMSAMSKDTAASAGGDAITGVPVGDSRVLTLDGLDSGGRVTYRGASTAVTVVAGQTADAGGVAMHAVLINPTQVSAGWNHTCALHAGGVACWGDNSYGRTTVPALTSPTQVSAGQYHTCAVHAGGVACWGYNGSGQTTVPALTSPTQVSAGGTLTCALHAGGVACWGDNSYGQTTVP